MYYIRFLFWSMFRRNLSFGINPKIGTQTFFSSKGTIIIGDSFFCGSNCYFSGKITFGDRILIASYVAFVGGDHEIDNCSVQISQTGRSIVLPTFVKNDAWIGHGAVILHGTTVGNGAVVGAGSVVTRDIPDFAVVAGNPAKILRYRNINETSSSIA